MASVVQSRSSQPIPKTVRDSSRYAQHGLALPAATLRALKKRGIYCQSSLTLEFQQLARRYVLRLRRDGTARVTALRGIETASDVAGRAAPLHVLVARRDGAALHRRGRAPRAQQVAHGAGHARLEAHRQRRLHRAELLKPNRPSRHPLLASSCSGVGER